MRTTTTTTTTTTRDRGDRYGPMEWAQLLTYLLDRCEHGGGVQSGDAGVSPGYDRADAVRRPAASSARWRRRVRHCHRPGRSDGATQLRSRSAADRQLYRTQGSRRTVRRHISINRSIDRSLFVTSNFVNKKQLKNVGPVRHNEPPHAHSADVASGGTVARRLRIDVYDNANDDDDDDDNA